MGRRKAIQLPAPPSEPKPKKDDEPPKELSEEQKIWIQRNIKKFPDLKELASRLFKREVKGTDKWGRLVRKYLVDHGHEFETTKKGAKDPIELTHTQKEYILNNANPAISAYNMAQALFQGVKVTPRSRQTQAVANFISQNMPEKLHHGETALGDTYNPPTSDQQTLALVNRYTNQEFVFSKLSIEEKKSITHLKKLLHGLRFQQIIDTFDDNSYRLLYESEFVRATWDKPDLTTDEINLYLNLCVEYCNHKALKKDESKLRQMFEDIEEIGEMQVKYSEMLKTKNAAVNDCSKRIESLIHDLNGKRSTRLDKQIKENLSMVALVKEFVFEENRERMMKTAEMQSKLIEEETERLEEASDLKARLFGMRKVDVI
jgi:hypothetical protein